ncbi:MAG: class I SAM-dependent methyltransferase [Alphaproteobacteria bacterium]|nr:class I SAM-dependent methyltransferase [Alphaproteobacteria bacterium]
MSTFADYSAAAAVYDTTRKAEAFDVWLGALMRYAPAPLDQVRLLDAGCGTGNYSAALAPHVGRLNGIDFNPDMLAQAAAKLQDEIAQDRAKLEQGSLMALPFEDETFDAVMINQVLHHLEDGKDPARNGHRAAVNECARVLKPGGILLVNACSHRQLKDGFWYNHLIPQGLAACCNRIAPTDMFRQMLAEAGLRVEARMVPADSVMQGSSYFELAGVLDPSWRAGDSIWAMAPEEEVTAACATVKAVMDGEDAGEWLAGHDVQRLHVGQLTFWIAQKADP